MKLDKLSPRKGARKNRKRIGRGNASGTGKTSGKGHKGQKARSGASIPAHFEGGQMPLYRRIPKVGFVSRKRIFGLNVFNTVDLDVLSRFEDGGTVDAEALKAKGYAKRSSKKAGIKVLGSGSLDKKLTVKVTAVTKSAREKIEAAGGTVELVK